MSLVPAKCPECGGNINIDPNKKAANCEFCKQPFIVEEAINNFNTTYNITNHNNIKADVVIINESDSKERQSENIKKRFNFFTEKIQLDDYDTKEAMCKTMKEYYDSYVKENPSEIQYLLDYFDMVMQAYYLVFDNRCSSISLEPNHKGVVGLLEYLQEEISFLNKIEGEKAKRKVDEFLGKVNHYIVKDVENYVEDLPAFQEVRAKRLSFYGSFTKDGLIYSYITSDYAKKQHNEIHTIREIAKVEKSRPLGISSLHDADLIWGHYFTYYDNWDGPEWYLGEFNESFITSNDVEKYVEEITQKHLNDCMQKRICFKCKRPLSLFGKCKNDRCEMFNAKLY